MTFLKEEVKDLLRKEREKIIREQKAREKEILALMEEQNLDLQGKLWGEESMTDIAARKNGGDVTKWTTDVEAEICSDINLELYGIDPDVVAAPMRQAMLLEAWELAKKTVSANWGETGVHLFARWLDFSVAELCRQYDMPAMSTMALIKSMVAACRKEAGMRNIFPFPEVEGEIMKLRKRINNNRSIERLLSGVSQPADPENRIYLTSDEKNMALDSLCAHVQEKYGVSVSRSTIHRAKKTGWFMRPGWKRGRNGGEVVFFPSSDKKLSSYKLAEKYEISQPTALAAKKRGFCYRKLASKSLGGDN
jgi:hypothetical protein